MNHPFEPPPNYPPSYGAPGESVLALICCGGVLAIPAIVFAAQVDGHLRQGNYQAAIEASNSAKLWLMIAVGITAGLTLFCTLPICVLYILAAIAAAAG